MKEAIKYQEIIDICHNQLQMTDDEINNLSDDQIKELNAYGALFEASKQMLDSDNKSRTDAEIRLTTYITSHDITENIEMLRKVFKNYESKQ